MSYREQVGEVQALLSEAYSRLAETEPYQDAMTSVQWRGLRAAMHNIAAARADLDNAVGTSWYGNCDSGWRPFQNPRGRCNIENDR